MKLLSIWKGLTVGTKTSTNSINRLSLSKRSIMRMRTLFFTLLAAFAFFSCETKVDLVAEGEESPIVFGFIDSETDTQFVKITKSFITDGNAFEGALDPTLSEYVDLEAYIVEYDDGDSVAAYLLKEKLVTNKDSGVFYYPTQTVYYTDEIVFEDANDPSYDNEFKIEFHGSGKDVSSSTAIIGPFESDITQDIEEVSFVQFFDPTGSNYLDKTMKIRQSENAKRYEFTFRFHYLEKYNDGSEEEKYMDFAYAPIIADDLSGNAVYSFKLNGEEFFLGVQSKLIAQNNEENVARRVIGKITYIFDYAGADLNTYIELNKPATSFNSEQNPYTNIQNGVGVWSARGQTIKTDKKLEFKSIQELSLGQYTGIYKFCSDNPAHVGLPVHCN